MRGWMMLAVVAGLVGCASWEEAARQDAFETTTQAYARALEWSDFAGIGKFVSPSPAGAAFSPESYRDFKVTSYQPGAPRASADGRTVHRSAVIGYVRMSRMVEQSVAVQEEWVYSDTQKRWVLQDGLPVFK